jgi:hypothetical protein
MKTRLVVYRRRIEGAPETVPPAGKRPQKEIKVSSSLSYRRFSVELICFLLVMVVAAWGSVTGSISGTVNDPSGSAVPNVKVTVQELNTGLVYRTQSDANGYYTLPVLPVGRYDLEVQAPAFAPTAAKQIVLDTNAALTINASLEVGGANETVSVNDNALHVETIETQLGQVITGRQMKPFLSMAAASPTCSRCNRAWHRLTPSLPAPCRTWAQPLFLRREH